MKLKKTNKKFYNKWLYKITLRLDGAGIFRLYDLATIEDLCNDVNIDKWSPTWVTDCIEKNRKVIFGIITELKKYDKDIWAKRIEIHNLDLYTNDRIFFNNVSTNLSTIVTQAFEPDEANIDLLENAGAIVGKKLPHNRYRYRVYLQPHKLANDNASKKKFIDWLKGQQPRVTCTTSVENWFMKTNWNWDRRYVLVEDEQTLLMLKLRNSDVVGKIYNYQIADK
jgi:hypothetical protein